MWAFGIKKYIFTNSMVYVYDSVAVKNIVLVCISVLTVSEILCVSASVSSLKNGIVLKPKA